MARDADKRNIEICKDVHKELLVRKAIKGFKTMDATVKHLLKFYADNTK